MKKTYIEDLVNHDDPESCVYCCKAIDEALTGAHTGRILSCENRLVQDADAVVLSGKQYGLARKDECQTNLAQSETSRMCGTLLRENREIPFSSTESRTCWEGKQPKPAKHENGKSDDSIVPAKQPNEPVQAGKEDVEGRGSIKGKYAPVQHTPDTGPERGIVQNGLERIRQVAKKDKGVKFTALLHHVTIDRLREAFSSLKRNASAGNVDKLR